MKKEQLTELGIDEETAKKVLDINGADIENAKRPLNENVAALEAERDGLKTQLDTANASLQALDGAAPADIKAKLEEAQKAQQEAVAAAEKRVSELEAQYTADIAKRDSRAETEKLLSTHKFINEITRNHYVNAIEAALDEPTNKGKGRDELFKALTQDAEGKPIEGVFLTENPNRLPGPPPAGNIPRDGDDIASRVAARYAAAKAETK